MAKLKFGTVEEEVVTRQEFPLAKAQEVLKDETIAVLGYGSARTRTSIKPERQWL